MLPVHHFKRHCLKRVAFESMQTRGCRKLLERVSKSSCVQFQSTSNSLLVPCLSPVAAEPEQGWVFSDPPRFYDIVTADTVHLVSVRLSSSVNCHSTLSWTRGFQSLGGLFCHPMSRAKHAGERPLLFELPSQVPALSPA